MRLRTVAKLGVILSVVLFCTAVGLYGFAQLNSTDKSREVNLFSLVPSDCVGVLASDNINHVLNEFPGINYGEELAHFQFPGLFHYLLSGLNEYTTSNAHGLSTQMSRLVVSFHDAASPRDQVVYFRMGEADEAVLSNMLRERAPGHFLPKKEKYRGKNIYVYPLTNDDFLASYSESGFFVVSYQKHLIEKVIDAQADQAGLSHDPVFAKVLEGKKSHRFLTLYGRSGSMPFLQSDADCWSEFDFHMNSDVVYLTGDTFVSDTCRNISTQILAKLAEVPDVTEDSLVLSANKEWMSSYLDEASMEHEADTYSLLDKCVANLSRETSFMLVADMHKVAHEKERFQPYLPAFMLENALFFRSFILSIQLSITKDKLSHIFVLTYKN